MLNDFAIRFKISQLKQGTPDRKKLEEELTYLNSKFKAATGKTHPAVAAYFA